MLELLHRETSSNPGPGLPVYLSTSVMIAKPVQYAAAVFDVFNVSQFSAVIVANVRLTTDDTDFFLHKGVGRRLCSSVITI